MHCAFTLATAHQYRERNGNVFFDYWQGVFVLLNKVRICVIPELKQIRIAWFQNWSWSEWEFLNRAPVLELTGCPAQFWNCSCMKQGILLIMGNSVSHYSPQGQLKNEAGPFQDQRWFWEISPFEHSGIRQTLPLLGTVLLYQALAARFLNIQRWNVWRVIAPFVTLPSVW